MENNTTKSRNKTICDFVCEKCDYTCSRKGDYNKHINSIKHNTTHTTKIQPTILHLCKCGKTYNHRASLFNHKKKCKYLIDNDIYKADDDQPEFVCDKEFVMAVLKQNNDILKQNNDLQTQVIELLKNGTHNTTNNNKTFNLNFFLNETCKNAMNIMDFVNSLQLQLSDLEKMGEIGYVNGMSNIIIKNLKDMDVTERPVHCTDMKREVLYVKDEDKWDKETNEKPKIRKAIKYVARKNARLLQEFKEKHPDCNNSDSKYSDTYNKLMIEAMGGKGYDDKEKETKIIKRLVKETIIDNN